MGRGGACVAGQGSSATGGRAWSSSSSAVQQQASSDRHTQKAKGKAEHARRVRASGSLVAFTLQTHVQSIHALT